MLVRLWRSDRPYPLKAGALIIASVLATPYALDYDMMVLAPAIAFLAVDGLQRGFGSWQKTALAVLWLAPIAARSIADVTLLPLGVWAMLGGADCRDAQRRRSSGHCRWRDAGRTTRWRR